MKTTLFIHSFTGSLFLSLFCDVVKVAIDPQKDFSQIWLQVECGSNNFQNILPYFLGTLLKNTCIRNMGIFLKFWPNYGYQKSQKEVHFSNINFQNIDF
jgi:membrane protein YqaA with SNARE-associated domain